MVKVEGTTKAATLSRPLFCYGWILEADVPISVCAITNGDEARDEDGGSGSECNECEVHSVSPLARATGRPGLRRSNKAFVISECRPCGRC